MKCQIPVRMPEQLKERVKAICKKEGDRSENSFIVEAIEKLVKEKENSNG